MAQVRRSRKPLDRFVAILTAIVAAFLIVIVITTACYSVQILPTTRPVEEITEVIDEEEFKRLLQ
jgi:hypothetical protein